MDSRARAKVYGSGWVVYNLHFKLLQFQQNLCFYAKRDREKMEKKLPTARKTNTSNIQPPQPQSTTFKNENVIFKIHSPKGQQNYNAKTFPAKFSINICNQPTELSSGLYNREPTQHSFPIPMLSSTIKNDFEPVKTERVSPNFDFEHYDKQIKAILDDKRKCDELIRELEQTCQEYQYQNQDLVSSLNQASLKIQSNQEKLNEKQKNQQELKDHIMKLKHLNQQLKHKIKYLENQIKKQKQAQAYHASNQHSEIGKLEKKIAELEEVILEKQQAIKSFSNFNNEIAKKLLDEQSYSSASHVKKMEKWLKLMSKRCQIQSSNSSTATGQSQRNAFISQLLIKCQKMQNKISELERVVYFLDIDFKQSVKQNEALSKINEELKNTIKDLQSSYDQAAKETQQSFHRKSLNEGGTIIYQGSIKVKMEALLIEKDKRINALDQQIMECRKENTMLKTKIYQLELERLHFQQAFRLKEDFSLKKARSLENFYQAKNDNFPSREKEGRQLNRIFSQCNDLTQTLGNFMQTYKPEKSIFEQRRKSRFSQSYQPNFGTRDQNKDKIQELVQLQKATYDMLQRNLRKQPISFQQAKWNKNRYSELGLQKQNFERHLSSHPPTERTSRQDYAFRRTQRSQKSCYFNEDL